MALFNATDGLNWADNHNWLSDAPIGEWRGVYSQSDDRVIEIDLSGNGLSGEIPPELGSLNRLIELLLAGNDLRGNIPPELANLSSLAKLDLSANQLSGEIPAELGNLTNLEAVWFGENLFTGCVPEALRNTPHNDFDATGLPFCGDKTSTVATPIPPTVPPEPTAKAQPTAVPEPTEIPTPTPTPTPIPTPTPVPTATPLPASVVETAFARFNKERQIMGLNSLTLAQNLTSDWIKVQEIVVGCQDPVQAHEELQLKTLHGIGISISDAGSECGLKVITYHIVPESQKMRVEKSIWDCFAQSADINTPGDVSCGGRFEAYGRHVKWHPEEIFYYTESQVMQSGIQALTSWVKEKTKVKISEVNSADNANLILYIGDRTTQECPGRAGCSYARQGFGNEASEIFIFEQGTYFNQVLKHELLHIILPMGHLPAGNTLMTVQPGDPSQTNNLTPKEGKLLKLYIDPYLRDGMTMDEYKQYLVIE